MCAASRRQEQPPLLRRCLRAVRALLPRIGLNAHVSLRYQMLTKTALPLLRGGPRASAPSQHKALWNHPSWESDDDALWALGPVMVKLPASGVLECVAWEHRMPTLLHPCGAVPKPGWLGGLGARVQHLLPPDHRRPRRQQVPFAFQDSTV
jgi:hypothetical protein